MDFQFHFTSCAWLKMWFLGFLLWSPPGTMPSLVPIRLDACPSGTVRQINLSFHKLPWSWYFFLNKRKVTNTYGFWGFIFRSSYLYGKCFTQRVISLPPKTNILYICVLDFFHCCDKTLDINKSEGLFNSPFQRF